MEQTNTTGSASGSYQGVVERVRSTATAQLSTQKNRATDGLGSIAQAVRHTTQPLRDNQQDAIARYVDKAADQIEQLSAQLRDKDVSELMADVQRFARRQPAVFIGAAFAAGLVASRFIKSSSEQSDDTWRRAEFDRTAPRFDDLRTAPGTTTGGVARHSTGGL